MAISQMNLENGNIFGLKYGGYEDPKTFEPFHLLLLGLDFIFNWFIDWATDPLAILVIFVFQCLGLIVNLIVYIMASGSQAMQSGLKKSLIYHHEIHLITSLLYTTLTCSWYVWALRKSWPSVSDQFSFSFGSDEIFTTIATPTTHIPLNVTTTTPIPTSTTTALTTLAPLLSNLTNNGSIISNNTSKFIRSSFAHIKNFFPTKVSRGSGSAIVSGVNSTKEFYTLWSSGFVALYTIQRTVAIIYYFVSLKATFLVLNASTIDSLEENRGKKRITKTPGNVGGGVRRISSTYPDTTDITSGMREGNKGDEFPVENWGRRGRNLGFGNNSNPLMAQANKKARMAASVSDVLRNNRKGNVPEM